MPGGSEAILIAVVAGLLYFGVTETVRGTKAVIKQAHCVVTTGHKCVVKPPCVPRGPDDCCPSIPNCGAWASKPGPEGVKGE